MAGRSDVACVDNGANKKHLRVSISAARHVPVCKRILYLAVGYSMDMDIGIGRERPVQDMRMEMASAGITLAGDRLIVREEL